MESSPSTPWMQPISATSPSGEELDYDTDFLALMQLAQGRPESQFAAAEPPRWAQVQPLVTSLMTRSHDLRLALLWARSGTALSGLPALAPALGLMSHWLSHEWETVHPRLDEGDPLRRLSVLSELNSLQGLRGELRAAPLSTDKRLGGLRARDVEVALGHAEALPGEPASPLSQVRGLLSGVPELRRSLASAAADARVALRQLTQTVSSKVPPALLSDRPDDGALEALLSDLLGVLSEAPVDGRPPQPDSDGDASAQRMPMDGATSVASDSLMSGHTGGWNGDRAMPRMGTTNLPQLPPRSRQDVLQTLRLLRAYLEEAEPGNPAQWLLRRAEDLMDKTFVQLIEELAPDSLHAVTRVLGAVPTSDTQGEASG
ncbi:ImpA family type VI secretion system protein [Roseateles amylovorans]|uniref:Type VI secretion system ImpA family N-terminal domain-containing protein n=1 Tax=Roseateles amylovorans TaxID=2978473 RepID=A0ABY6B5I1_9BURK|nr:type VI secretion system ImpA family N-terminal domain-containing protein [Roseateles amylovorans]UXH78515.1 type VI secretion system ImpA family N-terminal domain-containing protein [Roseateles amylovorans]